MKEQRLECTSQTCNATVVECADGTSERLLVCKVQWKVHSCPQAPKWSVKTNDAAHSRGATPCEREPPAVVTPKMKAFFIQESEAEYPPRLIWSHLKASPSHRNPARGYPTVEQISSFLKYHRQKDGSRNAIDSIRSLVREFCYHPDMKDDEAFVFGVSKDEDGYPYVGSGEDDDPLILGVASNTLLANSIQFASPDRFTMFHADATFKLSDLGYPAITCGFSDASRRYQLSAIFVVSRRTESEYRKSFQALFDMMKIVSSATIKIDALMADAEDAQLNASQRVPALAEGVPLMCFFHVLYNVRKRTRYLSQELRVMVLRGIMDMHYSRGLIQYLETRDKVLGAWCGHTELRLFAAYFSSQWLEGRFWRWQIFHSPTGYAVTNNPCETFNAILKVYTGRKLYDMKRLLHKFMSPVKDLSVPRVPVSAPPVTTSTELKKASDRLLRLGRLIIERQGTTDIVRVDHKKSANGEEADDDSDGDDASLNQQSDSVSLLDDEEEESVALAPEQHWLRVHVPAPPLSRDDRKKASQLYDRTVKWSLVRAHRIGIPERGWVVDVRSCICQCAYFAKFGMCFHVVAARSALKMAKPGEQGSKAKFKMRRVKVTLTNKKKGKAKATAPQTTVAPSTTLATVAPSTTLAVVSGIGRPPHARRALTMDQILS